MKDNLKILNGNKNKKTVNLVFKEIEADYKDSALRFFTENTEELEGILYFLGKNCKVSIEVD